VNEKTLLLAADFLKLASDELSNNGCNDWDFPKGWTKSEKKEFVKSYYEHNGTPEEYDPNDLTLPDWAAASYLSYLVKEFAHAAA